MSIRGERTEAAIRTAIIAVICLILYVGPASLVGIAHIFDSEMFGVATLSESVTWVGIIWLCAVPLVIALKKWDSDPATSVIGLGVFLTASAMFWMMFRNLGATLLSVALVAPFMGTANEIAWSNRVLVPSYAISFIACIVIPALGIAFQMRRKEEWERLTF